MLGMAYTLFRRTGKTILGVVVILAVTILVLGFGVSAVHVIIAGVLAGLCWHGVAIAIRQNKKAESR
jgi:hypothetical protein